MLAGGPEFWGDFWPWATTFGDFWTTLQSVEFWLCGFGLSGAGDFGSQLQRRPEPGTLPTAQEHGTSQLTMFVGLRCRGVGFRSVLGA